MRRPLITIALTGALAGLAFPAAAEDSLPGLYRVTGVETKLNIRAEPDIGAPVIGALGRDAADVEVVARDPGGAWGQVNAGERAGWVSLDYLRSEGDLWAEGGELPPTLRCFGTEPFWEIRHEGDRLIRSGMDTEERTLTIDRVTGAAGSGSRVVVARDKEGAVTLGIAPEQCGDGMSDRAFGLGARLSEGDAPALTGCCSVAPRGDASGQ
ncbi:SH3 domain-containing protein [Amaricoccus solimangrovi]|uniref:Peptide-binding protein n=1 Tax=Amaricoccus solimangrovi TaxID=2589815 RepID=A0A501X0S1_9RHOB|nr:SH3 domain-containing protein [Amaricoccus solimangrovi]TPE52566.1 peptide-binding protein [Amaricoccus solimangrovi]